MAISQDAVTGQASTRALQFAGSIQGHDILILIDSGSSHTFISQKLASKLQGVLPMAREIHVKVANGGVLQCHAQITQGTWSIQNY